MITERLHTLTVRQWTFYVPVSTIVSLNVVVLYASCLTLFFLPRCQPLQREEQAQSRGFSSSSVGSLFTISCSRSIAIRLVHF